MKDDDKKKLGITMADAVRKRARTLHEERMRLPLCKRLDMHKYPFRSPCCHCGKDWIKNEN